MLRPVIAQFYRRGKSLGCRDFSSSHSNDNVAMELPSVMHTFCYSCLGLALGAGFGALLDHIFVGKSMSAEEIERDWESKQQQLEELETTLQHFQKLYGVKSSAR